MNTHKKINVITGKKNTYYKYTVIEYIDWEEFNMFHFDSNC